MNVLIIGANGEIGQHLVKKLHDSDKHMPIAMVRKEGQKEKFKKQGVKSVLADLEGSIDDLANLAKEADAVVFTAGSGSHTGADKTMLIDLDGAVKSMKAAEQAIVKRFVMISGIGVNRVHDTDYLKGVGTSPSYYSVAKYYADAWLERSNLDYTILRPGSLTNDPETGNVIIGERLTNNPISREDVATAVIASLENDQTIGKSFDITSGNLSIEEALKRL
jgi:uncharacterized protein YbjT (DUF2867 family)